MINAIIITYNYSGLNTSQKKLFFFNRYFTIVFTMTRKVECFHWFAHICTLGLLLGKSLGKESLWKFSLMTPEG